MGGSGGGYFTSDVNSLKNKINITNKNIDKDEYETEVASLLTELLLQYNNRDVAAINTHLEEILKTVENRIDGHINLLLGGSVSKHTFVDGLSDIDTLLIINDSELYDKTPSNIKKIIANMLSEHFKKTDITIGKLAVTVSFSDYVVQILPAIKSDGKVMIPDSSGNYWEKIDTQKFTSALTDINEKNGKKVVPIIKLAKAIINNLPEKHQLSGYHVEALALDIFYNYTGERIQKTMLKYFFKKASELVLSPIKDKTGQSSYVDEYLGKEDNLSRHLASSAMDRLYRKMQNADNNQAIELWEDVFK